MKLALESGPAKFDETVELAVRLGVDPPPPSRDWYALLPTRRPSPAAKVLADFLSTR